MKSESGLGKAAFAFLILWPLMYLPAALIPNKNRANPGAALGRGQSFLTVREIYAAPLPAQLSKGACLVGHQIRSNDFF
jgi:hypothetical protein